MAQQTDPRILGTEKIGKLLLQYSIPAIIGMTITSLYNIIDSIFIGHGVGAIAISGLAITFPLMNLVVAFCVLISAGGATISSIRLGQKDMEGATEVLGNTLMLCLINSVVFGGIAFIFLDPILNFFGASPATLPYARDFMQVILLGTPVTYTMIGLNNVMRATGYPKKAMLTSLVTVLANVIIAPIFIFHFHWGIRGAAMATVVSQFIGMVWVVQHFRNKESFVHFRPGFWKMKRRIVANECNRLCHRDPYQQQLTEVWWRHGYRRIRYYEPVVNALRYDCYGTDHGDAAHHRLQLRCTKTGSCKTYAPPGYHRWCTDHK